MCVITDDTSVTVCHKVINATDSASKNVTNAIPTNMTNTISANVTASTVSKTSNDKKVRYKMNCYILNTVLSAIILLFLIAIIWYDYTKQCYYVTSSMIYENLKIFILRKYHK